MATSFNQQFDQHGAWRREFTLRLKLLGDWMKSHELLDPALEERLHSLEVQIKADKVMVAFVAACAGHAKEDVVYVDEPVTVEPTYTGKYN